MASDDVVVPLIAQVWVQQFSAAHGVYPDVVEINGPVWSTGLAALLEIMCEHKNYADLPAGIMMADLECTITWIRDDEMPGGGWYDIKPVQPLNWRNLVEFPAERHDASCIPDDVVAAQDSYVVEQREDGTWKLTNRRE